MTTQALLGQTVVLIGGSAGIGLETARLARAEARALFGGLPGQVDHVVVTAGGGQHFVF